ncbi:hypothetical protein KR038_002075 [Drosophila bunnanda]|nr:hypothetical protein KR038_002075 [Drosophila bunnanda]
MLDSGSSSSWTLSLVAGALLLSASIAQDAGTSNRIAAPGQALYYQMVDAGRLVAPKESLKRTNRSLLKWWDDLFPRNNNCCNNNNNNNVLYPPAAVLPSPVVNNNCNNGLQLQDLDPFKQMKLFKKLPELFPGTSPCGVQCGGGCGQPQANYAAPLSPSYGGGDGYGVVPDGGYVKPNPEYNGPGDGDAGYVAPAPAPAPAPVYDAPAPLAPSYDPPALPPADSYAPPPAEPAPLPPVYDPPTPPAVSYEPAAPSSYAQTEPASEGYGQAVQPSYVGAQPPQIVYQPIIYLSASPAPQPAAQVKLEDQSYASQAPSAAPIYQAPLPPTPSCYQPPAPPASPSYSTPSCQTPIRLSLIDQPYRVAPELFEEYNYRLAQNLL